MCTVVCRWSAGATVHMLALRDEFADREFDGPGTWWPGQPSVIGGRDRVAGGTWCACDSRTGAVAVVLNRPERRVAAAGAASRGVLPLLALQHGPTWTEHIDLAPMASFNLMLASADALRWWTFDGAELTFTRLGNGVHLAKPRGLADDQLTSALEDPAQWKRLLADTEPRADPSGLVIRIEHEGRTYATVFGQLITSAPGRVVIEHSRTPRQPASFQTSVF